MEIFEKYTDENDKARWNLQYGENRETFKIIKQLQDTIKKLENRIQKLESINYRSGK